MAPLVRVIFPRPGQPSAAVVLAEVARDNVKGLAGCSYLPDGEGMLFNLGPGRHFMWMKGCLIALDALWIARGRVVGVVHSARPGDLAHLGGWAAPAVLEVPGGWCARMGVGVGAVVQFDPAP